MMLSITNETYCAAQVALDYLIGRTTGEVHERMKRSKRDMERAWRDYCQFESGDVPAFLRRQGE